MFKKISYIQRVLMQNKIYDIEINIFLFNIIKSI